MKTHFRNALITLMICGSSLALSDDHDHDNDHKHDEAEQAHADEVKLSPEAISQYGIRVAPATKQALSGSFVAPARVAYNADKIAHIGSMISGRAIEMTAKLGDEVKKGDPLLVVESFVLGEAQSDYLQKLTALSVAAAAVEPAQQSLERAKSLYEKNAGIALAEVQKREAEFKAAQGGVQNAKAAVDAAKNKLVLMGLDQKALESLEQSKQINPRYTITSPALGTVIEREVTLGELVSPEKDALFIVADLRNLWVIADVPEAKLSEVRMGAKALVRVVADSAAMNGKVSYIAPSLDPNTRTAQVRIEISNADGKLRPGMFARADLSTAGPHDKPVLAVPEQSVQTIEGKPSVFVPVQGEENTFVVRAVKVGGVADGMLPIESGIKEGESIVVSGTFILKAELGKAGAAHEH